jgi:hypothetical protein
LTNASPMESLIQINHGLRILEHKLDVARRRKKWAKILLISGPVLLGVLWIILGFEQLDLGSVNGQISVVAAIVGVVMILKGLHLRFLPGGPPEETPAEKFIANRMEEFEIELEIALLRDRRKLTISSTPTDVVRRRMAYKEDAHTDIEHFRRESSRYRRVQNYLQAVLIIGSLATTGVAGISLLADTAKWFTMATSFMVGIASGFIGYFKYRERGAYLQQTADTIETEWEALELGIGRYKHHGSDVKGQTAALADFAEEVHRLKSEQKKREQNLDQPPTDDQSKTVSAGSGQ